MQLMLADGTPLSHGFFSGLQPNGVLLKNMAELRRRPRSDEGAALANQRS